MIYSIDDAIKNIFSVQQIQPRNLIDDINNARKLVYDVIRRNNKSLAIVQGPPGTGKTTVYELAIEDVVRNNTIDRNEMLVYIAPTNQLAFEMFKRILYIYKALGFSRNDVSDIRIYGSKFRYNYFDVCRSTVDENTRIVITTQYQRVYSNRAYHLLIDEASKTLLHQPFIPITNRLRDRENDILASLSIIGDPKQAIALDQNYRSEKGRRFLIMENLIHGLLTEEGIEYTRNDDITDLAFRYLRGNFRFLEITKRLPKPSETPISHGYYKDMLRGYYEARDILKDYELNKARELNDINDMFRKIVEAVKDAIMTDRPIIYARTDYFNETEGLLLDMRRSLIALGFAITLTKVSGRSTTIIAPYTDQIMNTKLRYRLAYMGFLEPSEKNRIRFDTIHSAIGAEDYNIVAILGKEYTSSSGDNKTIYYQEPELFNVQLSRHKGILVIIGNLVGLKNTASKQDSIERGIMYKPISMTAEKLLELAGYKDKSYSKNGDGAVYADFTK